MMPRELTGKRVTVAGLGHFGGNVAAARWLVEQGARVLVTDRAPADKLADSLAQLAGLPITYKLGGHDVADFNQADLVVASPAIPPGNEFLVTARKMGLPVTTEICLFLQWCPATVIGVTGTKGKSTTSAMIGEILRRHRTTWFGGNIGKSLLPELPNIRRDHLVVLELSSFMLHYTGGNFWSPHVAVLTMLAPDHLDWHGGFGGYTDAKRNILKFQHANDVAMVNEESAELLKWFGAGQCPPCKARIVPYGVEGRRAFELRIPGRHNQLNAQGAFAVAAHFGVTWEQAAEALADFRGLPHRLQLVHEAGGVRWFNDSIATIPQAAAVALGAFDAGKVVQIVGGSDKGLDISPMVEALSRRAKASLCIGATGLAVAAKLRAAGASQVHECGDLAKAVATARNLAVTGDVVLLSTGFASYDQFVNFEDRGERFAQLAQAL